MLTVQQLCRYHHLPRHITVAPCATGEDQPEDFRDDAGYQQVVRTPPVRASANPADTPLSAVLIMRLTIGAGAAPVATLSGGAMQDHDVRQEAWGPITIS